MTRPYTRMQIRLHWIIFALIAVQYLFHETIAQAWVDFQRNGSIEFDPLILLHVAGGMIVLVLVLYRIVLRMRLGAPPLPKEETPAMKLVARLTHLGLYALMIAMPVSGAAAWFGGAEPAADAHEVMRIILLALVVLHVAGALYHQFVLKNNLIARMKHPGTQ